MASLDALLHNFWFESSFPNQSDTGEAVLTNGPQEFVSVYSSPEPTTTLQRSGAIGDGSSGQFHPALVAFSYSEGIREIAQHNVGRVQIDWRPTSTLITAYPGDREHPYWFIVNT